MSDDPDNGALECDIRALAAAAQDLARAATGPDPCACHARAITTLLCAAMGLARQAGVEPAAVESHLRDLAPAIYVVPLETLN